MFAVRCPLVECQWRLLVRFEDVPEDRHVAVPVKVPTKGVYADEFGEDEEDEEDEDDLDEPAAMQNMVLSHVVLQIQ